MKKYYIKERNNPQFKQPYYVGEGQLTKAEAKRMEDPGYGFNVMIPYDTKEAYELALNEKVANGFNVH